MARRGGGGYDLSQPDTTKIISRGTLTHASIAREGGGEHIYTVNTVNKHGRLGKLA